MNVAEVDTPDVVWATIGVEEGTAVGFWKVDVFFGGCDVTLEVTAEIGLEWIDGDFGICTKIGVVTTLVYLHPEDVGLDTGGHAYFAEGFCHYISA